MGSTTDIYAPLKQEVVRTSAASRLLSLSLSDCFFLSIMGWLFLAGGAGWLGLLADGDTGWHIRTGEYILDHGKVPVQDLFSFSKAGEPWFAWEWLADVLYALLYRSLGLKGIVLMSGVVLAAYATVLLRWMIWRGTNALVALGITLVGVGASTIHFLARPHVFTLVLLALSLWIVDRDRRRPSSAVWLLPALTALWTNLHGGFVGFLACLGALAAGSVVQALLEPKPGPARWTAARRYTLLGAACGAASLVNPYGWQLHWHILQYLRSDWIRDAIHEFQSPDFRGESSLQFEALLFIGLIAAARLLGRKQVTEALWILLWAHLALASVRHVPIYITVAAPLIASELTLLWRRRAEGSPPDSVAGALEGLSRDLRSGFARSSVWCAVAVAVLVFVDRPVQWPKDFPDVKFPAKALDRHANLLTEKRVFTSDQWADYLIYRSYPKQKVFVDGRSDFYGPTIGKEYIRLSHGQKDWEEILARYSFDAALCPSDWPLISLLKLRRDWKLIYQDELALLFERIPEPGLAAK